MIQRQATRVLSQALVVLLLCGLTQRVLAETPIDISKLKKGDKLEVLVGRQWVPAVYVDRFSDRMINVKRADFPTPVGAIIDFVRLPAKRTAGKSAAADENPFATEDERIAARKPRTWSDRDGKFKVEATLLRVEDETVVLRRGDAKEIKVPLDRLSDADRGYLDSLEPSSTADASSPEPPKSHFGKSTPAPPEVPLTETHLGEAELVELDGTGWSYVPDPQPTQTPVRNVRLGLNKWDTFEQLQRLLLLPAENRAIVVTKWSFRDQKFNVQALDLQRGTIIGAGLFSTQAAPIAVSPDGKRILARSESFGFGKKAELRLYTRDGMKATPEKAWVPYLHHGPRTEGVHGPNYPQNADVVWADFLGSDRVISLSQAGELAVWNVADLKPLYQVKLADGAQAALSRGGKYLAVADSASVAILRTQDGKLPGLLPADAANASSQLDFSLDGRKLALLTEKTRLRVWDLTTQKLEREFAVSLAGGVPDGNKRELAWVAENYLLAGNQVVDVAHYRTVWTYNRLITWHAPWTELQGRVWYITSDGQSAPTLTSSAMPPTAAREKWAKVPPEESLAIHPGVEITVDLQTSDPHTAQVREKMIASLTQRGLKVVDDSPTKLVGTIGPGEAKTTNYRNLHGFDRTVTSVTVQGNVAKLSYQVGSDTVWSFETQTGAPMFMHLDEGQSIQQAAQAHADLDSKVFTRVWIPVNVASHDPDAETARSDYPGN